MSDRIVALSPRRRIRLRLSGHRMTAFALLLATTMMAGMPPSFAQEEAPAAEGAVAETAPAISTVEASTEEIVATTTVTGSLIAREEVIVGVDVEGFKIVELLAEVGDVVEAGDVLARLDAATIDIQLAQNTSQLARADAAIAQARASIAQAEAAKVEADAALARTQDLTSRGVTAQEILDQRISAAATATAQLNSARQGLEQAIADKALVEAQREELELNRSKTEIKAPASGIVLSRTARIGAIASPASEPLFRLAAEGDVELSAEVSEVGLAQLEVGMPVKVVPAGFDSAIDGEIRLIAPRIDPVTRLGEVRVSLDGTATLRPGAFARGTVEVARSTGVVVPLSALVSTDGTSTVQVVADGHIDTREVETGLRTAELIEIRSGVRPGDIVVRRAGSFVRDGDQVKAVAFAQEGR